VTCLIFKSYRITCRHGIQGLQIVITGRFRAVGRKTNNKAETGINSVVFAMYAPGNAGQPGAIKPGRTSLAL
jgi:hypothetical protein